MTEFNGKLAAASDLSGFVIFAMHCFVAFVPHFEIGCPYSGDNRGRPEETRGSVVPGLLIDEVPVL